MGIDLDKFCRRLGLKVVCDGNHKEIEITDSNINRPGLQLYGFYNYFDEDRVQIIGKVEESYLRHLTQEVRKEKIYKFFSYSWPCLIIAWDKKIEYIVEAAEKYNKIVLGTDVETTRIMLKTIHYLDEHLAPTISLHGVLVEVYGIGVFITGDSGIGKSETALELVKRGHRLISDDVVEIKKTSDGHLIGTAPELLKQFMEIRGIGIIDIRTLYGVGAVKESVQIDMCVHLEHWKSDNHYDRLGLEKEYMDILGVGITKVTIPVSTGRTLTTIIETAARNNREKEMGIDSAKEFVDRIYKATNK